MPDSSSAGFFEKRAFCLRNKSKSVARSLREFATAFQILPRFCKNFLLMKPRSLWYLVSFSTPCSFGDRARGRFERVGPCILLPRRGFPTKRRVARIRATLDTMEKKFINPERVAHLARGNRGNRQPRRGCVFCFTPFQGSVNTRNPSLCWETPPG